MSNYHRLAHALAAITITSGTMYSPVADASISDGGKPISITSSNSGRVFFDYNGTRTDRPSCATVNRWVINASTDQGKAMLSVLLTAKAQGKSIVIYGTNDCRDWGDTESIDYFVVRE